MDRLLLCIAVLSVAAWLIIVFGLLASIFYVGSKEEMRRFEQSGAVPILPVLAVAVLLWLPIVGAQVQRCRGLLPAETQHYESLPLRVHLGLPLFALFFARSTFSLLIPAFCTFFFGTDVSLRAQITETGIEAAPCNFAVLAVVPPAKKLEICVGFKLLMKLTPGDAIDINVRIWRGYTIRGDILKAAPDVQPREQPAEIRERILSSHFVRSRRD